MKVRFEPWGAWVRPDTMPALVALDQGGVRALGLDGGAAWLPEAPPTAPIEVHLAVTARCGAGCEGCYLDARPDGLEPPFDTLVARLDALRDAGVMTVAFGGGEPTTRADLAELAEAAVARGLVPVLTTSGLGPSASKLARLKAFAQVNVSYDGSGEAYRSVRGFEGAGQAERAIRELCDAGVRVGVNVVLTRSTFDALPSTIARARSLGASEAQLLRYKPAGRAAGIDYLARRLGPDQVARLGPLLRVLTREHAPARFSIRIDCSMVPLLSGDPDLYACPEAFERAGIFGCEGGQALASVKVDGKVAPCSFVASTALDGVDLARGHVGDRDLDRWRRYPAVAPEPCASCTLARVCKGGCKAVSLFVDGVHGPDPECPRVRAHRGEPHEAGRSAGMTDETPQRVRVALAFMGACVATVALYSLLRLIQARLFPEPNPATVIWSAHAGYFWRCWTVSYGGVMVGFAAYAAARMHAAKVARSLGWAVVATGVLMWLQVLFVP